MMRGNLGRVCAAVLIALPVTLSASFAMAQSCAPDVAYFVDADHATPVEVEIADTPAAREQGLMYRQTLPVGTGMLFVYPAPQEVAFWMKNTLIPLDMIFMDSLGVIRHIHRNAQPGDLTPIAGATPADPDPARQFILEVIAGGADALGLAEGQQMAHPLIPAQSGTIPCIEN